MAITFTPEYRSELKEILDEPDCNKEDLFQNLNDIRKFNKILGTRNAILNQVKRIIKGKKTTGKLRIIDICTGSADIPVYIADWVRKNKLKTEITAIDINPDIISFATGETVAYPEITAITADAFNLPYEKNSFHLAICSQAFHHFQDNDCLRLLKIMDEITEYGFVVNDLKRDWLNYYGAKLLGRICKMNYITRNDAPVSVLRAFTRTELAKLAGESQVGGISIHSYFMH